MKRHEINTYASKRYNKCKEYLVISLLYSPLIKVINRNSTTYVG